LGLDQFALTLIEAASVDDNGRQSLSEKSPGSKPIVSALFCDIFIFYSRGQNPGYASLSARRHRARPIMSRIDLWLHITE
jgi:hypothetical protein